MLYYALVFLIIGLIAGALGIYGVAAVAGQIAYVLFLIGVVFALYNADRLKHRIEKLESRRVPGSVVQTAESASPSHSREIAFNGAQWKP